LPKKLGNSQVFLPILHPALEQLNVVVKAKELLINVDFSHKVGVFP
jgi:hypothetical protein